MLVTVPCCVCQGEFFKEVYPQTVAANEPSPEKYFSSSRTSAGYLPIVRCTHCGMLLQNPRDDATTLKEIYRKLADSVYAEEDENRDRSARAHLAFVEKHLPARGRLLDVGCATGIFVAAAAAAGWSATGFDASEWAIERARMRCPNAEFACATLEESSLPDGQFEAVTLWDVLEHVDSPREVLQRVARWLKPGGHLFVSVPNSGSLTAKWLKKHWVLLLREHLWYFSPETLGRLLAANGFDLLHTQPKFVSFSLSNVAGRLAQYPGPLADFAHRVAPLPMLRRLSFTFPMGEMDVVARRVS